MYRPVELRRDSSSDGDGIPINQRADNEASESNASSEDSIQSLAGEENDAELTGDSEVGEGDDSSLRAISFGALVDVQQKLQPKSRKRKLSGEFEKSDRSQEAEDEQPIEGVASERRTQSKPTARQSKHAPTILSSKHQVSRKRDVFEPPATAKSRDPRFDPTVQASSHDRNAVDTANKNYSFLTSYQAAEILDLKSQIKRSKNPEAVADLRQRVMAIENKLRAVEAKQRQRDVASQHKQKEKEMIRAGQKSNPYYLKPGAVKKLAENERLEGMGKKARDKALERKRKREKTKEARNMPHVRRV